MVDYRLGFDPNVPCLPCPLLHFMEEREFGQFPRGSLAKANPQGWQRVAGGRSGQRGNDHRENASDSRAPRRVPAFRRQDGSRHVTTARPFTLGHLARRPHSHARGGSAVTSLAPHRGAGDCCAVARRSPLPQPLTTSGYPLPTLRVDPECPNSLSSISWRRGRGQILGPDLAYAA